MCRCFGREEFTEKLSQDEAIAAIAYRLCKENSKLDPVRAVDLAKEFIETARNVRIEMYQVGDNNRIEGVKHAYQGKDPFVNVKPPRLYDNCYNFF